MTTSCTLVSLNLSPSNWTEPSRVRSAQTLKTISLITILTVSLSQFIFHYYYYYFLAHKKGKLIKDGNSKTFQKEQLPGYSFYARMAYRQNTLIPFVMSRCFICQHKIFIATYDFAHSYVGKASPRTWFQRVGLYQSSSSYVRSIGGICYLASRKCHPCAPSADVPTTGRYSRMAVCWFWGNCKANGSIFVRNSTKTLS